MRLAAIRAFVISAILITASITTTFADSPNELTEASPSTVAGYYHSDDYDIIILPNGTWRMLDDSSPNLLGEPIDFIAYSDGDDFVLSANNRYAYFHEQKEKGKTDNGGIYYAAYMDFQGMEADIGYKEGKQLNYYGYIFGNDYDVYEKNSLKDFLGIDTAGIDTGKIEGEGYDTPEDALGAYIRGFIENDIDTMISTFAVETFVDSYDIVKFVDRMSEYNTSIGYIPTVSNYSRRLNIEKRRSDIVNSIRFQYLVLEDSKTIVGDNAFKPFLISDGYEDAQELLDDLFLKDDSNIIDSISFNDEYYNPNLFNDRYDTENNKEIMKRQAAHLGAEDVTSVVAKFYIDNEPLLLMPDAIKLNGRWYLYSFSGNISTLMGIPYYYSGIFPLKYDEDGEITSVVEG